MRDFVEPGFCISGFCSIQFTVSFGRAEEYRSLYTGDFVIKGFVASGFHSIRVILVWTSGLCPSTLHRDSGFGIISEYRGLRQKGVCFIGVPQYQDKF